MHACMHDLGLNGKEARDITKRKRGSKLRTEGTSPQKPARAHRTSHVFMSSFASLCFFRLSPSLGLLIDCWQGAHAQPVSVMSSGVMAPCTPALHTCNTRYPSYLSTLVLHISKCTLSFYHQIIADNHHLKNLVCWRNCLLSCSGRWTHF
jgi:hypothetical protein